MITDYSEEVYTESASALSDAALGCMLVISGAAAGWYARGVLAMPYDYTLLAWLVPVVTFIVTSRKDNNARYYR